jgi:L-threonylcarbamoyladenylate synthase
MMLNFKILHMAAHMTVTTTTNGRGRIVGGHAWYRSDLMPVDCYPSLWKRFSFVSIGFAAPPLGTYRYRTACMCMSSTDSASKLRTWRSASALDVAAAANALRAGHIVAFPTETVYGLGADARNDAAVRAVFEAKGRPTDNPLIVHLASKEDLRLSGLIEMPLGSVAEAVTNAFWPGPLTIVLSCAPGAHLSPLVTAGLNSVAIRVPKHPVAHSLLEAASIPIAAPSANRSGRPSPTTPEHVFADLHGRIYGILDDVSSASDDAHVSDRCGLESTVVDLMDESCPTILRPGAISSSDLERVAGIPFRAHAPLLTTGGAQRATDNVPRPFLAQEGPKAPGMKYRHYAPQAQLVLCKRAGLVAELKRQRAAASKDDKVGLLADSETCAEIAEQGVIPGIVFVECGKRNDAASVGRSLYSSLRAFDGEGEQGVPPPGVAVIVAVALEDAHNGVGTAIMNRLRKAAYAANDDCLNGV